MIQFEYDNFYRVNNDLDIDDMFKMLPDWNFFYVLPNGLIPIEKMRDDYIYTNIFASKKYPTNIIRDFKPIMVGNTIETEHVGEFMLDVYWELKNKTPDVFKNVHCIDLNSPDMNYENFKLDEVMKRYNSLYDR
jgi:hypothetical protein